jgi:hypothetical protein
MPNGSSESQATLGRDVTLESGRYGAWYLFASLADARDSVLMKLATWGEPRVERSTSTFATTRPAIRGCSCTSTG